jgi:putative DNA primase/helicase
VTDIASPLLSEDYLALQFTARHEHDLRSVPLWGKWLRWDGAHWKEDTTLMAFDFAREIVRNHAVELAETTNGNGAAKLASAKTVAAVERLARADRRHATTTDQWDADIWRFNQP